MRHCPNSRLALGAAAAKRAQKLDWKHHVRRRFASHGFSVATIANVVHQNVSNLTRVTTEQTKGYRLFFQLVVSLGVSVLA
jgi:hypothetical protein